MIALFAAASALGAEWCSAPVGVLQFEEAVARAELGIQTLDAEVLGHALGEADLALPCVDGVVGVDPLARYYRASAVHRLVAGDEDASVALFRSARALQPAFKLDPTLAPPIREAWATAEPDPGTAALPTPSVGTWVVEGRPSATGPVGRPFVVQWLGDDGGVRATALIEAGAAIPFGVGERVAPPSLAPAPTGSVAARAPAPVDLPAPAPVARERHPSRSLALGALATAVAAGAGVASAAALQEEVLSSPRPSADLSGLVVANRIVGYGAGGAAVVAVGLGAGAVLVGRW